jgi:phosphoglycerate dehydrogenase-like enzyme
MRFPGRPRVLVLAPDALFRSFFDDARQRRLSRSFRWSRSGARDLERVPRAALAEADALVTTWDSPRFAADALRRAPRVRIVGHCGGEVKGRFAVPLFERITITNAPGPMARYVAELAVAVLLYGARNVDAHRRALRRPSNAVYARIHRDGLADETLAGRTVGILGFGRIGREIAALLRPFGARLLVHDPYVAAATIRRAGATAVSWTALVERSRHLVLAAALTEKTGGILDRRALARLPDGAIVVNVARGALVDLDALTAEVRRGRLRCALDVTDPEPLPVRHPLRRLPGAILTPHVGAGQREVRAAMADTVLDDLERFFAGRRPRNRVSAAMLERMT